MKPPIMHPPLTGDVHQTWRGKRWWQKPGPWCRFKDRLGRRGAMLLTLGLTYVAIGYGEATRPTPNVPGAWHLLVDDDIRGAAWMLTGMVAIFFALTRPHRVEPPTRWWQEDTAGWLCLYVVPGIYFLSFMTSFIVWGVTDQTEGIDPLGSPLAWYNAVLRVPFIAIVLICSGWLENPRRCKP